MKNLREKNQQYQNRLRKDEKSQRMQQDHMVKLQERVRDMRDEKKTPDVSEMEGVMQQLSDATRQVEVAERARESETKKKNHEIKNLQKFVQELDEKLKQTQKELKEKDKQLQITLLRMKDVQRNNRHGQLTPLRGNLNSSTIVSNNNQSQEDIKEEPRAEAKGPLPSLSQNNKKPSSQKQKYGTSTVPSSPKGLPQVLEQPNRAV